MTKTEGARMRIRGAGLQAAAVISMLSVLVSACNSKVPVTGLPAPVATPDVVSPTITFFSVPTTSSSLIVNGINLQATDDVGVTGFYLSEVASTPISTGSGWIMVAPTTYTFSDTGLTTLYAWAKDAAGNVSSGLSASVTITLPDTTPPTVTAFTIPATSTSSTVPVSSFTATDNAGVTGYLITDTPGTPSASDSGWSAAPQSAYAFSTPGSKTLYAWAKDAAGNISNGVAANVTITLPGVIFSENFDEQPDWWPTCLTCGNLNGTYNGGGDQAGTPIGWNFWRADEYWNQYALSGATAGGQPVMRISSDVHSGTTGKAFIFSNESESNSPNGGAGGWSSDGELSVALPQDYPELYMQFKLKYQPGYKRHWVPGFNGADMKTARFYHWDRINSPYQYFSSGNSAPIVLLKVSENEYGGSLGGDSIRCDPQSTNYYCATTYPTKAYFTPPDTCVGQVTGWGNSDGNNTDSQPLGVFDGNWHTLQLHAKLNSAPGASDGIYEIIYDGCTVKSLTNIQYIGVGGDITAGWNFVSIGGNAFNNYLGITNHVYQSGAEQWYAIDDVIVSTSPIP